MKTFAFNITYDVPGKGVFSEQEEFTVSFNADCEGALIRYIHVALMMLYKARLPHYTELQIAKEYKFEDPEVIAVQFSDFLYVVELLVYDPVTKEDYAFTEMLDALGLRTAA